MFKSQQIYFVLSLFISDFLEESQKTAGQKSANVTLA